MARQRIINYHTSGTTAPLSEDIYYGELVVSHNSIGNTKIYTKVTNPSGDTNEGKIATFIDERQIDEKISKTNKRIRRLFCLYYNYISFFYGIDVSGTHHN